jgi:hypothetical protein
MNFGSKRMVAAATATLAVAGGAAAAVAATGSGSRGSDFLDSVAKHLGVSPQKLKDATKAAATDQVDADLAAGRITKAQADELKKRIEAGDGVLGGPGEPGFGKGPLLGGPDGPGFSRPVIANEIAAAAKYLGLTEDALRTKLRGGQSLADVAKAQSKDVAGLKTAILDAAKADLDNAVADTKVTQSQADNIYNGLKSRIDDIVDANVKLRDFRGPGGPGSPGIGFGFGADTAAAAKYLGLDDKALRDKLRGGQSLADVAKAQSKDVQGLEDAIVASQKARLDQAVSDKKLTQSEADDMLAKLKSHVDDLVNAKPPDRPTFRGRRGAGPKFSFGP